MAIVFPPAKIARHWNGALDSSRKRAPLVEFLRHRGLKVAQPGPGRNSDNISRATLFIVNRALRVGIGDKQALNPAQRLNVGQTACCICDCLASMIGDPNCWRVAALVSGTQLISSGSNLSNSANAAAISAQQFKQSTMGSGCIKTQLLAAQAIVSNLDEKLQELTTHVALQIQDLSINWAWIVPKPAFNISRRSPV